MTYDEMIAVITAYKDGKKIQFKHKRHIDWKYIADPNFNFNDFEYRVMPEPTYRPYANAKEFVADSKKHGGWVQDLKWGGYMFLNGADESTNFKVYLEEYAWEDDGSPCGVKEEE